MTEENTLKFIKDRLEAEGYSGLYCESSGECACCTDDLAPCGMVEKIDSDDEWINSCVPGYKHVDPRSHDGEWVVSRKKEPPTEEEFDKIFASC